MNKGGYKMDEVRKFIEALQNDPKAKEFMDSIEVPVDDEKGIDVYLDLAKKLGFSLSREDFLNWMQEKAKECKARAEKAQASMKEALDLEKMSMVAGGEGLEFCEETFNNGERCCFTDSCKYAFNVYYCVYTYDGITP